MKLATPVQISKLESLLLDIKRTNDVPKIRGYFSSVQQILNDINSLSQFSSDLGFRLIGADTEAKLREPTQILENAIDYYKRHAPLVPPKEQPTTSIINKENPINKELQIQNNQLLKAEKKRLEKQANILFASLVFFVPLVCGIYFVVALFKFKTMDWSDPTTWIDGEKFGNLEFLIILFEGIVVTISTLVYKNKKANFVSWFYEWQKVKIN